MRAIVDMFGAQGLCEMQAEGRGFADILTAVFSLAKDLHAACGHAATAFTDMISNAQRASDFVHQGMPLP